MGSLAGHHRVIRANDEERKSRAKLTQDRYDGVTTAYVTVYLLISKFKHQGTGMLTVDFYLLWFRESTPENASSL